MPETVLFTLAILAGLALLTRSADRFVDGASGLALNLGVSPLIIGLTIVAFGTSAPEVLVSAMAAWNGKTGLAIGSNIAMSSVVGSNLFNILGVLGIAGVIGPGGFSPAVLTRDLPLMIGLSVALYLMARGICRSHPPTINRWEGGILLAAFIAYQVWLYLHASGMMAG